jgi:hypothetical protein
MLYIKVAGKMGLNMVKESKRNQMEVNILVNGLKEKRMEKEKSKE